MSAIRSTRLPRHEVLQTIRRPQPALFRACPTRSLRSPSSFRCGNAQLTHTIARHHGQARCMFSSSSHRPTPDGNQSVRPQRSFAQTLSGGLRFGNIFRGKTLRKLFRESPEETALAVALLLGVCGAVGYTAYMYFNYFYAKQFTRYPPEIAKSLRRALYYSNHQPDPKLALKYYKLAIEQCNEHGLDPFSDDVVGIKIQLAAWLEKLSNVKASIQVLEMVLTENKKWLSIAETAPEKLPRAPLPGTTVGEGESARTITKEDFEKWFRSSRTRILGKSVGISTKLGELYANEQVLQQDQAHEHLMWAVETGLREFRRRQADGVKDGEGSWMSREEIGGALESLGHSYERKDQFELALPLLFQALRLCDDQCHMAVVMNNLAVAYAQHPPRAPFETLAGIVPGEEGQTAPPISSDQKWTRKELLESAQRWANNAYQHAKEPTGEKRTPECDEACAVALVNLGNIATMAGDFNEAHRRYKQSIAISEKNGFADGVKQAQAGLRQLAQ